VCRFAVVKLGGSVVTFKDRFESVDLDSLRFLSVQLSSFKGSGGSLVVVHGGGSFGHVAVSRLLAERGRLEPGDSSLIQESMFRLALIVLGVLREYNLRPVLHPPHSICYSVDPSSCMFDLIQRDLVLGLTPVTYGDAIPEGGSTRIISGDELAVELALRLNADCLIFVIRAPGVLDENGRVIKLLDSIDKLRVYEIKYMDVTGGIVNKISLALKASKKVREVRIVGLEDLENALNMRDVGTKIKSM